MHPVVANHLAEIAAICRRDHVRRLELFGSAARDDFDASRADVDFIVEFEPDFPGKALDTYFGLKSALETLLGRPVDLVEPGAVRNPYVRAGIDRSREKLFVA
jgi:hypothetical protein